MSLANVQGKLSRAEMKNVMAGNDLTDGSIDGGNACSSLSENDCRQRPSCTSSANTTGKCGWTAAWNRCTCASS